MMYTDKGKQKEAVKAAVKRHRTKQGITLCIEKGITSEGITQGITFDVVASSQVYNRPAVRYELAEPWELRPELLSPEDRPKQFNRGVYTRPDCIEYQFDVAGSAHDVDIKGRAADRAALEQWAKGIGTDYHRSLGILAMKYAQVNGIDWPGSDKIMAEDTAHCQQVSV